MKNPIATLRVNDLFKGVMSQLAAMTPIRAV